MEKEADEKASPPDQAAAVVAFAARSSTDQEGLQRVIPASPAIRRVARELGVDIRRVTGTGPRGRITKDDLQQAAAGEAPAGRQPQGLPSAGLPDFARWGEIETESFSNVRRLTAERMAHNWLTVPHVTQHDECDVTELEKRRKQYARQGRGSRHQADGYSDHHQTARFCSETLSGFQRQHRCRGPEDHLQEIHPHRGGGRHASGTLWSRSLGMWIKRTLSRLPSNSRKSPGARATESSLSMRCRAERLR